MRLQDCTMGKIVCERASDGKVLKVGMIAGITNNINSTPCVEQSSPTRAIPFVKWSDGTSGGIHHSNIHEFKDSYLEG